MKVRLKQKTTETREIEKLLKEHFDGVEAYRYNPASIRVRVIDARFAGKSVADREQAVMPLVMTLGKRTREDILMLLMLAPDEVGRASQQALANQEFESPSASRL